MAIDQILPSELHVGSVILYLDPSLVAEEFSNFLFLLIWAAKGESGRVIKQLKLWLVPQDMGGGSCGGLSGTMPHL